MFVGIWGGPWHVRVPTSTYILMRGQLGTHLELGLEFEQNLLHEENPAETIQGVTRCYGSVEIDKENRIY